MAHFHADLFPTRLLLCSYVQQCCLSRLCDDMWSLGVEANLSAGGSLFYYMYLSCRWRSTYHVRMVRRIPLSV